jgi:HD-GYP domain-containing protein (c-di-GMP phosphodiesterase class II)
VLNKPSVLTEEEFAHMRQHSILGYNYARDSFLLSSSCHPGIRDHHEKFDGTGYPDGRSGNEISLFGRIISVADVYDALTSERPYRSAMSASEAMEYIMGHSGTDFDPDVVNAFLRCVAPYPVGSTVQLSNGCTAIVVENFANFGLRPRVRVIAQNGEPVEPYEINLSTDFNYLNVIILGSLDIPEDAANLSDHDQVG